MDQAELQSLTEMVIRQFAARNFDDPKTLAGLDATLARLRRLVARQNDQFPQRSDGTPYELTAAEAQQVRQAVLNRLG